MIKTGSDEVGKERLLKAAGEVFAEVGYKAATIREITSRAGMNVAAVNYYLGDKESLYSAAVERACRDAFDGSVVSGPPDERLAEVVSRMLRGLGDSGIPSLQREVIARELAGPASAGGKILADAMRPLVEMVRGILREVAEERLEASEIDRVGVGILAQCLLFQCNRPLLSGLYPDFFQPASGSIPLARHISESAVGEIERLKALSPEKLSYVLL